MNNKIIIIMIIVIALGASVYIIYNNLFDDKIEVADNSNKAAANVSENVESSAQETEQTNSDIIEDAMKIIFLHHSTGENIWNGGVANWFNKYNADNGTNYQITEQNFPKDSPYGWENYPYDYWNIWVNHAGDSKYQDEPTLEILTKQYNVIIWKHCFPVSDIEANTGSPDVSSSEKTIENYKLQYNALKAKIKEFPNTKFIVWTGAAQVENATTEAMAKRAREFFQWVKNEWNEPGDNIFIWDFYEYETEGGLYLLPAYAESADDSHPKAEFSQNLAPLLGQHIVYVIEGSGDRVNAPVE
ncbi:MAG: hypothetical protein V1838_04835 [Patescibacteria group bacterium]